MNAINRSIGIEKIDSLISPQKVRLALAAGLFVFGMLYADGRATKPGGLSQLFRCHKEGQPQLVRGNQPFILTAAAPDGARSKLHRRGDSELRVIQGEKRTPSGLSSRRGSLVSGREGRYAFVECPFILAKLMSIPPHVITQHVIIFGGSYHLARK